MLDLNSVTLSPSVPDLKHSVQTWFVFSGPFQIPFLPGSHPCTPQADVTPELNTHCIPDCAFSCNFTNKLQWPLPGLVQKEKVWFETLRVKQTKPDKVNVRLERKWGPPWPPQSTGCGSLISKDQDSEKGRTPASFPLLPISWHSILSVFPWSKIQNLGPWTESLWCDNWEEQLWQLRKTSIALTKDAVWREGK